MEQIKPPWWAKAALWRKIAASRGRFLHHDNEPNTVVIESESVFGFEMLIKGEAETESLEANRNMMAASFKPLVLLLTTPESQRHILGDAISDLSFSTSQLTFLTV